MLKRVLALAAGLAVAAGWIVYDRLTTPYRGFSGDEVFVDIPSGSSVASIAERLLDAGAIRDVWTFRIAARLAREDRRLKAGEYRFAVPATPAEVAARLARGDVYVRLLTFPEGQTILDMAGAFERSGLGHAADFEHAATNVSLISGFDPEAHTLEGYLFPATYALTRHTSADETVRLMVAKFENAFDARLRADAASQGLDGRSVVTLASLIEKETAQPDERPLVSAVFRNRLKIGMPMQCDPTVIYALALAGRWNGNITKQDLQIDSPYNTYRHPGLPPGPIASPGRASLDAAVHPADVSYLYFVSRNDGTHVFASTLAEHERNVLKYQIKRTKH
jgi:UPF0755 protein